jgi:hypothetical protein
MDSSRMSSEMSLTGVPPNRVRSYIRPVCGGVHPPGQHGHSRTAGQSWCRPQEPGLLSARCGVGSTDGPCVASLAQHLLEDSHQRFIHRSIASAMRLTSRRRAGRPPPGAARAGGRRVRAGAVRHAASDSAGRGSNSTSRVQTAQTIRPSLLATAIVALL